MLMVTSKNVIPVPIFIGRIQNFMKSPDSCFRRSDEFGIIRGSLMSNIYETVKNVFDRRGLILS